MTGPDTTQGAPSVRLVFAYEGDAVRLLAQVPVYLPPDPPPDPAAPPGEHVEVRTANDDVLGRVAVHPQMSGTHEVFPEDPRDPIVRTELPEPRGAFTVVVAAPEEADRVAVVRSAAPPTAPPGPPPAGPQPGPAAPPAMQELGTFPLDRGPR